ncbi:succinylglutamate desuccinylase/aspartoacylase family protein [Mesorhizobium sp. B1-1-4]|nr:succinylglutamate desuccinylase/aspartoacylase family protein [Mesorhizobium sp. B2-6-4]TPL17967.1 succinylglutamate desuccinylase/aspartoacylase family protein [Mesorhizobium sp. B2-4-10]TPM21080.1 succinylglutamate desuccinylase/aspartoacylase family protein [Mesorhizobium sp. B2-3-6]TPM91251.1 succinylglutamate desuccinylase/aspartoacylase family protein [Mesorhizobium sp. B2-1-5]TPN13903.1 succinylglutamate desuccinylase/aspartoacylase family protein [Mesorhizobium sp. B2-1-3]TPN46221.1
MRRASAKAPSRPGQPTGKIPAMSSIATSRYRNVRSPEPPMSREILDVPLANGTPGSQHSVRIIRYGAADARPKAYIHAALHADEAPGLLVLHHLVEQLDAADARGEIRGQIVVVPYANPLGLAQFVNGDHLGRYDLASGRNFNRKWPDVAGELTIRLADRLGSSADDNTVLIRSTIREILDERGAGQPVDSLYTALAREAFDSDLVLDLHCDDEGLMHLFVRPEISAELSDLARELGCRAVFSQGSSGGSTFAEASVEPWIRLAAALPDKVIPIGCLAATVELRGFIDISDEMASADASALLNVLRRRGYVAGQAGLPPAALCEITGFDACDVVRTPAFGVIVYRAELGERVTCGQPIADIIVPSSLGREARVTVRARTDGLVVTRRLKKLVAANQVIAKVVGQKPLAHRTGYLLED